VRTPKPLIEPIYESVSEYARVVVGSAPMTISIIFANGTRLTLEGGASYYHDHPPEAPSPVPLPPTPAAEVWPPNTGWSYDHGRFSCDSQVFEMRGRPGEILRLLIIRGGSCDLEAIRAEVWAGYPCEDSVIRTAVSRLRKNLAEIMGFPADFDPIDSANNVYNLKHI
jgi:hypothetical protein